MPRPERFRTSRRLVFHSRNPFPLISGCLPASRMNGMRLPSVSPCEIFSFAAVSHFRPRLLLACLLGFLPAWLHGAYTARKALELLVQSVPKEVSSQIVAIIGFNGTTEPDTWYFLARSPSGTLQEFQVRDGEIRGPRSLPAEEVPEGLNRPLPAGLLPVDSHDVARLIDDAVILEGVSFARIDYQLCWREKGPEPLWMATLVGAQGETLGHMFISAQSGQITHRAFYHQFPRLPPLSPPVSSAAPSAVAMPVQGTSPGNPGQRPPLGTLFRKRTAPAPSKTTPTAGEEGTPPAGTRSAREAPHFLKRR